MDEESGQLEDLVRLDMYVFHIVCNQQRPGTESLDYPSLSNTEANYLEGKKTPWEFSLLFNFIVQAKNLETRQNVCEGERKWTGAFSGRQLD